MLYAQKRVQGPLIRDMYVREATYVGLEVSEFETTAVEFDYFLFLAFGHLIGIGRCRDGGCVRSLQIRGSRSVIDSILSREGLYPGIKAVRYGLVN